MSKKSKKPDRPHENEELEALFKESDRGAVLVAAHLIQDALESLLRTYFLGSGNADEKCIEDLISPDRYGSPLGNSGPRVAICRVFGLLDEPMCELIEDAQRMRNNFFAHYSGHTKLADKRLTRSLDRVLSKLGPAHKFMCKGIGLTKNHPEFSQERIEFTLGMMIIANLIRFQEMKLMKTLPNKRCIRWREQRGRPSISTLVDKIESGEFPNI